MRIPVLTSALAQALTLFVMSPIPAIADGEKAGDFDYYVMAMSWSPNFCALEGDRKGSEQCENGQNFGWVLHGLWPQSQDGWPTNCRTTERQPNRSTTAKMSDIMGSSGLAWYQWKKHGTCSGLSAPDYYAASRDAFDSIRKPEVFRKLTKPVRLPAKVVEEAFIEANPVLEPDMITITCRDNHIQEARICLSKDLSPVPCGRRIVKDCRLKDALFVPID